VPVSTEFVRSLPKAEVHVHLEGCLDASDIEELAREAGESLPRPKDRLFEFSDLGSFLEFLDWACALVRSPDQLARLAYRFAQREEASGVRYSDLLVSPIHWTPWRDRLDAFVGALDAGLAEAERDGLPRTGLCISLSRSQSSAEAMGVLEGLLERGHPRVVALSIDGNEAVHGRTSPRFAEVFERAAEAGLHRTVHAGESSGPEGVWDAIDILKAERIDHGVRSIEDDRLVRELADRGIPLDICPLSNVTLGLYKSRLDHPLESLRQAGVMVSVNTDDPALFGCRLDQEYFATADAYGWDESVVRGVARTSVEAAFCGEDLRRDLLRELEAGT
jgi:adenosine deaminase